LAESTSLRTAAIALEMASTLRRGVVSTQIQNGKWDGMNDIDRTKINEAVRKCLEFCYGSSDVLARVASFVAELKAAGGWNKDEIRAVEIAVHKVLQGIVARSYPGDVTNQPFDETGRSDPETTKLNGA
jgi:hypothetical protein